MSNMNNKNFKNKQTNFYIFDEREKHDYIFVMEDYTPQKAINRLIKLGYLESPTINDTTRKNYNNRNRNQRNHPFIDFGLPQSSESERIFRYLEKNLQNNNKWYDTTHLPLEVSYKTAKHYSHVLKWAQNLSNKENKEVTLVFYYVNRTRGIKRFSPEQKDTKAKNYENPRRKVNNDNNATTVNKVLHGLNDFLDFLDEVNEKISEQEYSRGNRNDDSGHKRYAVPTEPPVSTANEKNSGDESLSTSISDIIKDFVSQSDDVAQSSRSQKNDKDKSQNRSSRDSNVKSVSTLLDEILGTNNNVSKENQENEEVNRPERSQSRNLRDFSDIVPDASREELENYLEELIKERDNIDDNIIEIEDLLEIDDYYNKKGQGQTIFPISIFFDYGK